MNPTESTAPQGDAELTTTSSAAAPALGLTAADLEQLDTLLAALRTLKQDLATVCAAWQPYPQTMINVRIQKGQDWQSVSKEALAAVEKELEGKGRVVLRASGTEPVVRVMVEARQADWAQQGAERIAAAITGAVK